MPLSKRLNAALKLCPYIWPNDWAIRWRVLLAVFLLITTIALNVGVPLILRQAIHVITEAVVTIDAMGCQSKIVEKIVGKRQIT